MCHSGANGPKCEWERGFSGDRCAKPKHLICPRYVEDSDETKPLSYQLRRAESAYRKNSAKQTGKI